MVSKEIARSHILPHSLLASGLAGRPRHHRKHVRKGRFITPKVEYVQTGFSKRKIVRADGTVKLNPDGTQHRLPTFKKVGNWHSGNRRNNHHK